MDGNDIDDSRDDRQWAQSLVATVDSGELQGLYEDLLRIATDKRVTKSGREIARRRADALLKEMSQNP